MKDIDFIPDWYRQSKRRQLSIRTKYITLAAILLVMLICNAFWGHAISRADSQVEQLADRHTDAQAAMSNFNSISAKIDTLEQKAQLLEDIDSRIDIPAVLGEISFLMDKKIMLSNLVLKSENFELPGEYTPKQKSRRKFANKANQQRLLGTVRFKVVLTGIAADSSDVAKLVLNLEDSPYFHNVIPIYSRNANSKDAFKTAVTNSRATEFEVTCYLANYRYE